jgi:hypothetical protein
VGSGNKGAFAQRARMMAQDHPISSRNCSTFGRSPLLRWRCLTRKSAVSSAMIQPCDAS